MYSVLYEFKVKPEMEEQFVKSWSALTKLIYKHEGSLGSRLHKKSDLEYIAYALWPNKAKFNAIHNNLPDTAIAYRDTMRASCNTVGIMYQCEVIEDLLHKSVYEE
jgi:heme-degrading monooxygenase HmoA